MFFLFPFCHLTEWSVIKQLDHSVYYMSHLLLILLFLELNLLGFFAGANMSLLFWTPAQREKGMLVA